MTLTSATDEKTYDGTALTNKDVTFTAGCASKRYDGTPLTNNTARVSSGSIADIQTWTVSVSQTAVGTGRNVAADAVIKDGEIPLAALPKTGQSSVKSTLTMMMSGIILILTAMSKKRKEENS